MEKTKLDTYKLTDGDVVTLDDPPDVGDCITIKSLGAGGGVSVSYDDPVITIGVSEKQQLLWEVFLIEGERRREREEKTRTGDHI